MEFPRRGPASAGGADGGRRFPDPPSQGEREPTLVLRDALLSQLHMVRLRQETIEAERAKIERAMAPRAATAGHQMSLQMPMPWHGMATAKSQPRLFSAEQEQPMAQQNAEFYQPNNKLPDSSNKEVTEAELAMIERAMALRAATGGHQTQATPMPVPVPWHGVATVDAGRSQPWPFSTKQPMAVHNAEFGDQKLQESNKDALLSQLHMARLRQEIIEAEVAQIERALALRTATGGHQAQTTPMPMPWHGVTTMDDGRSKAGPFSAEQPVAQQNTEFDEHKLPDSNKAVLPSKASPAEKWELTGITIPATKPKLPMKWNCTVCQVQATSEQNLHQHYDGQKHLSNVATLDPTTKASDQKAKSAADHSLGTEQKKTSSIKWSCSTCQANGTSQLTLEAHLKGKRHQQSISATCVEGDMDGMPKSIAAQEAKAHGIDVLKNSKKLWPFIADKPMAQEFDEHKPSGSNKAVPPSKAFPVEKWKVAGAAKELKPPMKWNCTVCQVQATSEQDLQKHYAGQKHLSNVATLDPTTKAIDQNVKTAAGPSLCTEQKKTSTIKWSCSTCQANGTSQSTLEAHLKGRRHQQNTAEGDKNGMQKNVVAQEAKSHGINVSKHSEKLPSAAWICSICDVTCTCQTDLENHLRGMKHREKVQSLLEQRKSMARGSESQKAMSIPDSRWICRICHAHCTSESDLENHLLGSRHQLNIQGLREKIKQEKNNPPQVAKSQEPSSKW